MSEPVSNAEIEDVLSSIRRLVSENSGPIRGDQSEPARAGKLVLTPAFLVHSGVESDEIAPETTAESGSERARENPPVATDATPAPAEASDEPAAAPVAGPSLLEQRIAELEAVISRSSAEFEPDGSEEDATHPGAVIAHWSDHYAGPDAPKTDAVRAGEGAHQGAGETKNEVAAEPDQAPLSTEAEASDGRDDWLSAMPVEDEASPRQHAQTHEPEMSGGTREEFHSGGWLAPEPELDTAAEVEPKNEAVAQPEPEAPEAATEPEAEAQPVPEQGRADDASDGADEEPSPAEAPLRDEDPGIDMQPARAEPVEPDEPGVHDEATETAVVETVGAPEITEAYAATESVEDIDTGEIDVGEIDAVIDEDALREMVSRMVREELQGPIGERITHNVRRLVRREIARALSLSEFE